MSPLVQKIIEAFADFPYKPLLLVYAVLASGMVLYACIRAMVVRVKVNRFRKKLENVITKKYKNTG